MSGLKIAVLGGGSSYTPELVEGIIKRKDTLPVSEIVLIDVELGKDKVAINEALVKRMFQKEGLNTKISSTLNRREGLKDAHFVMSQMRVGGLKARALDEKIPLSYGMIGQETTGMGGFFKALRTIPVMLDVCRDMEELCPDAWLINFTNPSGIVTEAILKHTNIKCLGLCNVPINMHYDAAEKLGVDSSEIQSNFIGLNHLSFMNRCMYNGQNVMAKVLETTSEEGLVKNIEKVEAADELAQQLGLMCSPYMQYFFFEKFMLDEELESLENGKGTRAEQVMKVEKELFELYQDESLEEKPAALSERGGSRYSEAAISLVHSIYNNTGDNQVVNVLNGSSIEDLDSDCSVEVNCIIDSKGATPVSNGKLPKEVAGIVKSVKAYEQYAIEAAISGDRDKAILAMINHPLVHDMNVVIQTFDALVEAHREYLELW